MAATTLHAAVHTHLRIRGTQSFSRQSYRRDVFSIGIINFLCTKSSTVNCTQVTALTWHPADDNVIMFGLDDGSVGVYQLTGGSGDCLLCNATMF